jgi:hypothetical protein
MSSNFFKAADAKILTGGISGNEALMKLNISKCALMAEGGKALAAGLKGNQVITELNISDNALGMNSSHSDDNSGIIAIADAIPDMRALSSLNLSSNMLTGPFGGEMSGNMLKRPV